MQFNNDSFGFLKKLAANNNRDWFQDHKKEFDQHQKDNKIFFRTVASFIQNFDEIEDFKVFRIYRDIRFSKDKTPYKNHFSCRFIRATQARRGTYYLHIQPGASFCAVGFYGPERGDLYRIRKEFEIDDNPIRKILSEKKLQQQFPHGLQGDELKTSPRDFDGSHPAIDLIRKKQFYLSREFTNEDVLSKNFSEKVAKCFEAGLPFIDYMSEILTTDLNGESMLN